MNDWKQQLVDIYAPWNVPFWQTRWFFILMISTLVVISGLTALGIYLYFRKKKKQKQFDPLELLTKITQMQTRQAYDSLVFIIRFVLHKHYSLKAHELTEKELITEIKKIENEQIKKLDQVLETAIEAKFAPESIERTKLQNHIDNIVVLVKIHNEKKQS